LLLAFASVAIAQDKASERLATLKTDAGAGQDAQPPASPS
jgi:hypothetical protein